MGQEKLFVRKTTSTETTEGVQQSNITVFVYESFELAWSYFAEVMSEDEWSKQIETREGFYTLKGDGFVNTIFLETRKIHLPDTS